MTSDTHSVGSQPPKELQGWKEIADCLGVTVRRAQQWEAELQLPISRIQLGHRARVLANTADLDAWRRRRLVESGNAPVEQPINLSNGGGHRQLLWALVAAGPLLVAVIWLLFAVRRDRIPVSVGVRDGLLAAYDANHGILWQKALSDHLFPRNDRWTHTSKESGVWVSNVGFADDVDADGQIEVVGVETLTPPMGRIRRETVHCFDARGRKRWAFAAGRKIAWQGRQFDDAFFVHWVVGPFDYMGHRALAVGSQNLYFPFQIAVLEASTGKILGEYWHTGGLPSVLLVDQNGDGKMELLAGGVNNPGPGQGLPALVRLQQPLPLPMRDHDEVFRKSEDARVDYVLFPPVAGLSDDTLPRAVHWLRTDGDQALELAISSGPERDDLGQTIYTLGADLTVRDVRPDDLVRGHYDRLFLSGVVPARLTEREIAAWADVRRFSSVPNANSAAVRALWNRTPSPASPAAGPANGGASGEQAVVAAR